MTYRIEDITEADYGCEERPEGAPLMCCLVLSEVGDTADAEGTEGRIKSEGGIGSGDRIRAGGNGEASHKELVYRSIPDDLANELYLEKGQVLTEEELKQLQAGRKPEGWDDISHRNTYQTDIGPVCMSAAEYRSYREMKEEQERR